MTRARFPLAVGLVLAVGLAGRAPAEPAAAPEAQPAPSQATPEAAAPTADQAAETVLDALISAIRERPLFSADRHPPAPPPEQRTVEAPPPPKTPPVLVGRLAGMTLGPDDRKSAVFARPGEKPTVVKEGDEIDGWTVSSIEASRVVLSSAFGEKIVQPTPSVAGEGALPEALQPRKAPVPAQQPARPGSPQMPNFGNPAFPNPQMARPPVQPGRPLAASRRNQ